MRTIPVVLFPGETEAGNDVVFTRWVHRYHHLPRLWNLQDSTSLANVRLERKLRFDFATQKAKGQLRSFYRTRYAAAATYPHSSVPAAAAPSTPAPTGGKRYGSTDPKDDVQKRQRHADNPATVELRTPTSSPTPGTLAAVPSTGTDRRDNVAAGFYQHGTVDLLARQLEQALVGESRRVVDHSVHEVQSLCDRVARLEGQMNLLFRVHRLVATPTRPAQAPRDPFATDHGKA
uniref:Uncharacterized protein n=1 Tax=Peronospora matthiolae TaxID=2874970 RepID=A0AAV1UTL3_9STRA